MSITRTPVSDNQSARADGTIGRTQWLGEQLYPFESHFVEIEGG